MTNHEQVPFTTLDGEIVEVDAGMLSILEQLKRLGVKTQFSCQDNYGRAYVLADYKSFDALTRRIRYGLRNQRYDERNAKVARKILNARKSLQVSLYRDKGSNRILDVELFQRAMKSKPIRLEYTVDNSHGARVSLRWPVGMIDDILRLLELTCPE